MIEIGMIIANQIEASLNRIPIELLKPFLQSQRCEPYYVILEGGFLYDSTETNHRRLRAGQCTPVSRSSLCRDLLCRHHW